jgi:hypothetical protein
MKRFIHRNQSPMRGREACGICSKYFPGVPSRPAAAAREGRKISSARLGVRSSDTRAMFRRKKTGGASRAAQE